MDPASPEKSRPGEAMADVPIPLAFAMWENRSWKNGCAPPRRFWNPSVPAP